MTIPSLAGYVRRRFLLKALPLCGLSLTLSSVSSRLPVPPTRAPAAPSAEYPLALPRSTHYTRHSAPHTTQAPHATTTIGITYLGAPGTTGRTTCAAKARLLKGGYAHVYDKETACAARPCCSWPRTEPQSLEGAAAAFAPRPPCDEPSSCASLPRPPLPPPLRPLPPPLPPMPPPRLAVVLSPARRHEASSSVSPTASPPWRGGPDVRPGGKDGGGSPGGNC